jgi:hypothetical protein
VKHVPLELAAHHAGVKPGTIRLWVHRGHIRRYDDGYDLAEITAWIGRRNRRKVRTTRAQNA